MVCDKYPNIQWLKQYPFSFFHKFKVDWVVLLIWVSFNQSLLHSLMHLKSAGGLAMGWLVWKDLC